MKIDEQIIHDKRSTSVAKCLRNIAGTVVFAMLFNVFTAFSTQLAFAQEAAIPKINSAKGSLPTDAELARRASLFRSMEYIPANGKESEGYQYRLFIPDAVKQSIATGALTEKKYPLLVWLHGYGESGDDNWRHLAYIKDEVTRWEDERAGFPAFVLAFQSPYKGHWERNVQSLLMQLVEQTVKNWPIDTERIYLSGVSSGGTTCWQLGSEHPGTFVALAPMASSVVSGDKAILANIPIWAFQVTNDPVASPKPIRQAVAAIQANGGSCWLTETAGKTHDCWTAAFNDYGVIDWLLSQRRNSPAIAVPRWVIWKSFRSRYLTWEQLWPMLVLMVAVIGLAFALRRELRVRRLQAADGFSSPQ